MLGSPLSEMGGPRSYVHGDIVRERHLGFRKRSCQPLVFIGVTVSGHRSEGGMTCINGGKVGESEVPVGEQGLDC